jgi:hypothetical protein
MGASPSCVVTRPQAARIEAQRPARVVVDGLGFTPARRRHAAAAHAGA